MEIRKVIFDCRIQTCQRACSNQRLNPGDCASNTYDDATRRCIRGLQVCSGEPRRNEVRRCTSRRGDLYISTFARGGRLPHPVPEFREVIMALNRICRLDAKFRRLHWPTAQAKLRVQLSDGVMDGHTLLCSKNLLDARRICDASSLYATPIRHGSSRLQTDGGGRLC